MESSNYATLFRFWLDRKDDEKSTIPLWLLLVLVLAGSGCRRLVLAGIPVTPTRCDRLRLQQCVPNQQQHQTLLAVRRRQSAGRLHAGLKDRNGPLQWYLLMPTYRINGTESPLLLDPLTPNFFWQAWRARHHERTPRFSGTG